MRLRKLSEYKATIYQAWAGNVATHNPRFVTDGHSLVLIAAISRQDHDRLNRRKRRKATTLSEQTVESLWQCAIAGTVYPATPLGVQAGEYMNDPDRVWLDDGTDRGIAVNAHKLAYLLRITKADRILADGPKRAMVLTRSGQPVALLSPIDGGPMNMQAVRDAAAQGGAA